MLVYRAAAADRVEQEQPLVPQQAVHKFEEPAIVLVPDVLAESYRNHAVEPIRLARRLAVIAKFETHR